MNTKRMIQMIIDCTVTVAHGVKARRFWFSVSFIVRIIVYLEVSDGSSVSPFKLWR